LETNDPQRAARVRARSRAWVESDEEPCPALDRETGTCDLYAWRPLTCRTFGPPVRCESGGLAVCELCFDGATAQEIEACVVDLDVGSLDTTEGEETVAGALCSA
jgi:Fe-S-cluster containining protein